MAKRVNIKEFKEFEKKMTENKVVEFQDISFEVKPYISATDIQVIINLVANNAVNELDKTYNQHMRNVMEVYLIARYFTNINFADSVFEMYDLLVSTGLYLFILHQIPEEQVNYISDMIDQKIEEEKDRLAREGTFVGVLEKLVNSLDIDKMTNAINNFDPKVLENIPKHDLELLKKK